MITPLVAIATSIVRAWTRVYTWQLPREVRDARRAEIESDLWEFHADPAGARRFNSALQILARLVIGMPDDLWWRAEHSFVAGRPRRRRVALAAAAIVATAAWLLVSLQRAELPDPPPAKALRWRALIPAPPPPPPPPPPPCLPWGPQKDCIR